MLNTIATRWRLYPQGWRQFGLYCMHCDARATHWADNVALSANHAKQCKRTQKQLKARRGLVRALEGRQLAYAKIINS